MPKHQGSRIHHSLLSCDVDCTQGLTSRNKGRGFCMFLLHVRAGLIDHLSSLSAQINLQTCSLGLAKLACLHLIVTHNTHCILTPCPTTPTLLAVIQLSVLLSYVLVDCTCFHRKLSISMNSSTSRCNKL